MRVSWGVGTGFAAPVPPANAGKFARMRGSIDMSSNSMSKIITFAYPIDCFLSVLGVPKVLKNGIHKENVGVKVITSGSRGYPFDLMYHCCKSQTYW